MIAEDDALARSMSIDVMIELRFREIGAHPFDRDGVLHADFDRIARECAQIYDEHQARSRQ